MGVLSIQSSVAAGHVGNSAAVFALQRLGFDVWRVDTVAFSNHPAHGRHTGRIVPSGDVAAILTGLEALALWPRCDAVISGYLATAGTGQVVADTVSRIRAVRKDVLYLCDPVIGDHGRRYVEDGLVDYYRERALPAADLVTPNAFEAQCLTGIDATRTEGALAAANALRAMGPRMALVTGVAGSGGIVDTVAADGTGAWRVRTPQLALPGHGSGDLLAALLAGYLLRKAALPDALSKAVSAVHAVLASAPGGSGKDLPLIAAQEAMLNPSRLYPAEPVG
jgi:pyridoxine kinase